MDNILKTNKSFKYYLSILTNIGVDTNNWLENTKDVTDLFLDAVDFEEDFVTSEIMIRKTELDFLNISSLNTFEPIHTYIQLTESQLSDFLKCDL